MLRSLVLLAAVLSLGRCGGADVPPGAKGGGAGGSGGCGGGATCGAMRCPAGFDCHDGRCRRGDAVLVPFDLTALRQDGSLDLRVLFTPQGGGSTQSLAIGALHLDLPAVEVRWAGPGSYQSDIADLDPWWRDRPLLLTRSGTAKQALDEGVDSSIMAQSYQDMGWGLWMNEVDAHDPAKLAARQGFLDAHMPVLGYIEGTGDLFVFLAAIDKVPKKMSGSDVTRLVYTHWNWGDWGKTFPSNLKTVWVGPHDYFEAPPYAEPYTRHHPLYGDAVPLTDAYGSPITSPPGAAQDPRLDGLYRSCATADLNGEPGVDLQWQAGKDVTGLPGVVQVGGKAYSILGFGRDPACPAWLRMHQASIRLAIDQGSRGCWMDNVSLWDATGLVPAERMFGSYANARFESWLLSHASAAFMTDSDLAQHEGQMDMRCIVKWKARTGFGDDLGAAGPCNDPISASRPGLMDPRWDADLPWGAWLAYQLALHVDYYHQLGDFIAEHDPEFLWGANDLSLYGAPVAAAQPPAMDMSELTVGRQVMFGPVDPPPAGRIGPLLALSGALDRAQFHESFLYADVPGRQDSAALHTVLAAEALAYDALLMPAADDPRAPGTTASAAAIHAWLRPLANDLAGRQPWGRFGVVYSPVSWLRSLRPGGMAETTVHSGGGGLQVRDLRHPHAYAGWFTGLEQAGYPARALIASRLGPGDLDGYDMVVLPDVEVLPATLRDEVLVPWVDAGGTLVVSGGTGRYRGREALFEPWTDSAAAAGLESLTGVADLAQLTTPQTIAVGQGRVVVVPGSPGAEAWRGLGDESLTAAIDALRAAGWIHSPYQLLSDGGEVLVRLHADRLRGRLYVTLVNRAYDVGTDTLAPAGAQQLEIELPDWLVGLPLGVRAAGKHGQVSLTSLGDRVRLSVPELTDTVVAIVESALP